MMNDKELEELNEMLREINILQEKIANFLKKNGVRLQEELNNELDIKESSEEKITSYLMSIGVPVKLIGFKYIKMALTIMLNSKKERIYITKEIYPEIASKMHSTQNRVEAGIRHSIQITYRENGENEVLRELAKNKNGAIPSNGEFLAFIAEKIRLSAKN